MNKYTVELDYDTVDSIVVQVLQEQYKSLIDDRTARESDKESIGSFFTDKEKDIAEINRHLDAMETILSYNMVHTVFEEWKNEVSR
jgi:actin-like ATPase involved in cell morphogenesis